MALKLINQELGIFLVHSDLESMGQESKSNAGLRGRRVQTNAMCGRGSHRHSNTIEALRGMDRQS